MGHTENTILAEAAKSKDITLFLAFDKNGDQIIVDKDGNFIRMVDPVRSFCNSQRWQA